MAEDDAPPLRRGRDAHAEAVARAMRENLKKRKAKARARRAPATEPERSDANRSDRSDGRGGESDRGAAEDG
jgi:hypothetical protein